MLDRIGRYDTCRDRLKVLISIAGKERMDDHADRFCKASGLKVAGRFHHGYLTFQELKQHNRGM